MNVLQIQANEPREKNEMSVNLAHGHEKISRSRRSAGITKFAIDSAKPAAREYTLGDSRGLFLIVTPEGGKLWRFRYSFEGRRNMLSFGPYPYVTIPMARERREDAIRLIHKGVDPASERKQTKAARAATLTDVAKLWYEKELKGDRSTETLERAYARIVQNVLPTLGRRPIAALTGPEFLSAFQTIVDRGAVETAHRTKYACNEVMAYAISLGVLKFNPILNLDARALPRAPEVHLAALISPKEVGRLLLDIEAYKGFPVVAGALKLAPYVFLRPVELRTAEWEHITLDSNDPDMPAEWRIPATRMKGRIAHTVPLSKQAIAILRDMQRITGKGTYVFPSARGASRPMSNNAILSALRSMGYTGEQMTGHGFRTVASTMLNDLGIAPELIEMQLAHRDQNKIRDAYNRSTRLTDRRKLMQFWADHLDKLRETARKAVTR